MVAALLAASHLAVANPQASASAAPPGPPAILQVYRETVKPGSEAEYDRLESENARECARLRCPHAYLGLESLAAPKEVWWLNGYESEADRRRVAEAWAASTEAMAVLSRNGKRKAALVGKGVESIARIRQDLSGGQPSPLGTGPFLVIWSGMGKPGLEGTTYETDDGTRLVIVTARTREEAEALARGSKARAFAVRPSWSHLAGP